MTDRTVDTLYSCGCATGISDEGAFADLCDVHQLLRDRGAGGRDDLGARAWRVTVETRYGELLPQVVDASNLADALHAAAGLRLEVWFPQEE